MSGMFGGALLQGAHNPSQLRRCKSEERFVRKKTPAPDSTPVSRVLSPDPQDPSLSDGRNRVPSKQNPSYPHLAPSADPR